jgi:hypothetical protein
VNRIIGFVKGVKQGQWVVAGAVAVVAAFLIWSGHEQRIGALKAEMKPAVALEHAASARADSFAAKLKRDTVVLHRRIVQRDSIHDTVMVHLTDTVRVKEFIAKQDTIIVEGQAALRDCTCGWDAEKIAHQATKKQLQIVLATTPSKTRVWFERIAEAVIVEELTRRAVKR